MNFWIWFSIPPCCLNHKLPHVRNTNTDHFLFEEKGGKDDQETSPTIMVLAFGKLVCLFHDYLPSHSRATLSPVFSKVSRIPQWKMRITLNAYLIYLSLIKVQYIVTVCFFCMSSEQQHLLNLHICSTVWNIGIEMWVMVCFVVFSLVAQSCSTFHNPMDCSHQAPLSNKMLQARILEWVASLISRDLPDPGTKPRSTALQADSSPSEPPKSCINWWSFPS